MYDVVIVGAGASGLMTGICCANKKLNIAILERNNDTGKKLYATGNGHCNFLNTKADHAKEVKEKLESIGIIGKESEDGRIYPLGMEASFVAKALNNAAKQQGCEIICDFHVTDILRTNNGFKLCSKDGRTIETKKLVLATGGKAGIQYGCYGEGYRWVQSLGHSLRKPIPALVGLETTDNIEILHGVRVNAKASLIAGNEVHSDFGEVQFTKDSISGICVMNLGRYVRFDEHDAFILSLDLFADKTKEELVLLLKNQSEKLGDALLGLIPKKLADYIYSKINSNNFDETAELLKNIKFNIKGTKGWDSAQVTSGGVPFNELDEYYESKLIPGLFIVGELADYDGPCGGYNLCHAFWSGMQAGKKISGLDR